MVRASFIVLLLAACFVPPALAEKRVALVIGNASYVEGALENPVRDATAIASRLRELDFEVVQVTDGSLRDMQQGLVRFLQQIERGATALVFYAGHGIQANGRNYLMPVEAKLESEMSLRFQAMEVTDILEELERSGARMNIVILDACRNNPFERKFRGGSRGLAVVDAAVGTLIAYATAPGSVASDGDGRNGLYTQELLKALQEPGLKVEAVFKQVRREVSRYSAGAQIPWESSSLTGEFVFNGAATAAAAPVPASGGIAAPADKETLFWSAIAGSRNAGDFSDYLSKYPGGNYRSLAERRMELLSLEAAEADGSTEALTQHLAQHPDGETAERARAALAQVAQNPEPGTCDDLTGRWFVTIDDGSCSDVMTLTRTGDQVYDASYDVCSAMKVVTNIKGIVREEGDRFLYRWKSLPCSGTTEMVMDEGCQTANGSVVKRGGLPGLCAVFVKKGVGMQFRRDTGTE